LIRKDSRAVAAAMRPPSMAMLATESSTAPAAYTRVPFASARRRHVRAWRAIDRRQRLASSSAPGANVPVIAMRLPAPRY
jgi:hypothetical protein